MLKSFLHESLFTLSTINKWFHFEVESLLVLIKYLKSFLFQAEFNNYFSDAFHRYRVFKLFIMYTNLCIIYNRMFKNALTVLLMINSYIRYICLYWTFITTCQMFFNAIVYFKLCISYNRTNNNSFKVLFMINSLRIFCGISSN